jgi:DNA-binding transcriptional LysR family regulator
MQRLLKKHGNGTSNTTIEQWAVLRTVIEQESFAQAAIVLSRSQSSVSYAIARLQEGLGIQLMEVQGRRAVLTEAGLGLLTEAIPLINDLALLEQRGRAIRSGSEVRIRLLVDTLFPKVCCSTFSRSIVEFIRPSRLNLKRLFVNRHPIP